MSRKVIKGMVAISFILFFNVMVITGCALHKDKSGEVVTEIFAQTQEGDEDSGQQENPKWQEAAWEKAKEEAAAFLSDYSKVCPECEYSDYRVEYVKQVYTYENLDGKRLLIYQMNFELLAKAPENVVLAGGAEMTEDGWVVPDYPNSRFLVFEEKAGQLSYLGMMFENDCLPGDEIFTEDMKRRLELEK